MTIAKRLVTYYNVFENNIVLFQLIAVVWKTVPFVHPQLFVPAVFPVMKSVVMYVQVSMNYFSPGKILVYVCL